MSKSLWIVGGNKNQIHIHFLKYQETAVCFSFSVGMRAHVKTLSGNEVLIACKRVGVCQLVLIQPGFD